MNYICLWSYIKKDKSNSSEENSFFFFQFLTFHRPENQFTEKITDRLIPNKYNGDICVICVAATSV